MTGRFLIVKEILTDSTIAFKSMCMREHGEMRALKVENSYLMDNEVSIH